MSTTAVWNFFDPASKETVLGVLQEETDGMVSLGSPPERWTAPTACELWEVRDVIAHLVDTTEGYLPGFDIAHHGGSAPEPLGLRDMARHVDESAKALRKVPQEELLGRLRDDADRMMREFEALSEADWSGMLVPHPFMGSLPAMFYPIFQLVDYAVHNWDIREGAGQPHSISGDSADLLAVLIPILWQSTADVSSVDQPFSVGIRTSGRNGGDTRADVTSEGVNFVPGDIAGCPATIEFDPASFVLTAFGRINGGTVRGDQDVASRFRSLFFAI